MFSKITVKGRGPAPALPEAHLASGADRRRGAVELPEVPGEPARRGGREVRSAHRARRSRRWSRSSRSCSARAPRRRPRTCAECSSPSHSRAAPWRRSRREAWEPAGALRGAPRLRRSSGARRDARRPPERLPRRTHRPEPRARRTPRPGARDRHLGLGLPRSGDAAGDGQRALRGAGPGQRGGARPRARRGACGSPRAARPPRSRAHAGRRGELRRALEARAAPLPRARHRLPRHAPRARPDAPTSARSRAPWTPSRPASPMGATNLAGALGRATHALLAEPEPAARRVIVLLTDGVPTAPRETPRENLVECLRAADRAAHRGVRVLAFALGEAAREPLAVVEIAERTGGALYPLPDAADLPGLLELVQLDQIDVAHGAQPHHRRGCALRAARRGRHLGRRRVRPCRARTGSRSARAPRPASRCCARSTSCGHAGGGGAGAARRSRRAARRGALGGARDRLLEGRRPRARGRRPRCARASPSASRSSGGRPAPRRRGPPRARPRGRSLPAVGAGPR